jgi:hypothetical protein
MKIFVLSPQSIQKAKRKALIRGLVSVGFSFSLPLAIFAAKGTLSALGLVLAIPLILIACIVGVRRGLKNLDENLSSYQLLVSADSVVRRQAQVPDLEIHQGQITKIDEKSGAGLFIRTADKTVFIYVPEGVEKIDELKEILARWLPSASTVSSKDLSALMQVTSLLFYGIALATMLLSTTVSLVLVAGIFLIAYSIWSAIYLWRRKDLDARSKGLRWANLYAVLIFGIVLYARVSQLLKP